MDTIKENMFFVVMGAVVLLALVLFVVVVQPLKSKNSALQTDVQSLERNLDRLVREKLPNKQAMIEAKSYSDRYKKELDTMVDELAKMRLSSVLPGLTVDDPGAYKAIYDRDQEALKKKLLEKRITTSAGTWNFWNWGDSVPSVDLQRLIAAKEFSLMSELIAIITSPELHVMQLDRLEVSPGETRTQDYRPPAFGRTQERVEPYFDVFPFVIEVRMPFERHEILIRELLRSSFEMPIYIRKISMMRIEDDPRVTKQVPPLFVGIRVDGWALDYRLQDKKSMVPGNMFPGQNIR